MDAPIPPPREDDDEDVNWALSTAGALWGRGERAEALKWLRRAAEQASDANADLRSLELFKAAAELAPQVAATPSTPPAAGPAKASPSVVPQPLVGVAATRAALPVPQAQARPLPAAPSGAAAAPSAPAAARTPTTPVVPVVPVVPVTPTPPPVAAQAQRPTVAPPLRPGSVFPPPPQVPVPHARQDRPSAPAAPAPPVPVRPAVTAHVPAPPPSVGASASGSGRASTMSVPIATLRDGDGLRGATPAPPAARASDLAGPAGPAGVAGVAGLVPPRVVAPNPSVAIIGSAIHGAGAVGAVPGAAAAPRRRRSFTGEARPTTDKTRPSETGRTGAHRVRRRTLDPHAAAPAKPDVTPAPPSAATRPADPFAIFDDLDEDTRVLPSKPASNGAVTDDPTTKARERAEAEAAASFQRMAADAALDQDTTLVGARVPAHLLDPAFGAARSEAAGSAPGGSVPEAAPTSRDAVRAPSVSATRTADDPSRRTVLGVGPLSAPSQPWQAPGRAPADAPAHAAPALFPLHEDDDGPPSAGTSVWTPPPEIESPGPPTERPKRTPIATTPKPAPVAVASPASAPGAASARRPRLDVEDSVTLPQPAPSSEAAAPRKTKGEPVSRVEGRVDAPADSRARPRVEKDGVATSGPRFATLPALRVAVLATSTPGEVRLIALDARDEGPPGVPVAVLVPTTPGDGDAIARLFQGGDLP